LRTFSIAAAPCFLKSSASASRKSLLNDLRVASNDPPGFPRWQAAGGDHGYLTAHQVHGQRGQPIVLAAHPAVFTNGPHSAADELPRNPTTGIAACCACTASGSLLNAFRASGGKDSTPQHGRSCCVAEFQSGPMSVQGQTRLNRPRRHIHLCPQYPQDPPTPLRFFVSTLSGKTAELE